MTRMNEASRFALQALLSLAVLAPPAALAQRGPSASSVPEPPVVAGTPAAKATDAQKKGAVELFKAGLFGGAPIQQRTTGDAALTALSA
ncbi:MAG: hypothetical protein FJ095_02400 [Deltaproteobacteria bacterium]|nr:hypothetical protein [Deltaproteobacteria bacterium]